MLRGGAIVNVEGATLGGFEFYIDPTDRFVAAQRLRFESLGRSSKREIFSPPIPCVIFYALSCRTRSSHWIANNRDKVN